MSGGTKKTTQESAPWAAAQPALQAGLDSATELFNSGELFKPYTGSLVTPFSSQTQAGMNALQGNAEGAIASGALNKPVDWLTSLYGQGGLSADQQGVADQWRNTASGAELGQVSPAFADAMRAVQDSARDSVNLSVSGAGRYGSGQHTDVLAKSVGDVTNRMMVDEYGRQLQRQDAARSALAGLGQQGMANMFGATAALPGAWQTAGQPAMDLMTVGALNEDLTTRQNADAYRIAQEQNQQQQKATEWLTQIGSGIGAMGGTTTQTTPGASPLQTLLGAGLGLTSLFGNPFASLLGPAVGGVAGAATGAPMDIRPPWLRA